jgi:hypothetical protein
LKQSDQIDEQLDQITDESDQSDKESNDRIDVMEISHDHTEYGKIII